jgi:hypothetical protein
MNLDDIVDLRGAQLGLGNFGDADFRFTDFSGANLINANLFNADLRRSILTGAVLIGANLANANLTEANLSDADLRSADLEDTVLLSANLSRADVTGANLSGSKFGGTILGDLDISTAEGVQGIRHYGPSVIDRQAVVKSARAPISLFRGCGLEEWEIEAAKLHQTGLTAHQVIDILYRVTELRTDPLLQFYSCFFSYSHEDRIFVFELNKRLQERGVRCWLDSMQILPGHDIMEEVDRRHQTLG